MSTAAVLVFSGLVYMLSHTKQFTRAEILQALKCVSSNVSFASANGDINQFCQIFPDSKIWTKPSQGELCYSIWINSMFQRLFAVWFLQQDICIQNVMNLPLCKLRIHSTGAIRCKGL